MEVILREEIEKLGGRGDVVKVANGYARNYLLPQRKAVAATDSNRKIVEQERQSHLKKEAKLAGEATALGELLTALSIHVARKAGENDHLFGSVTAADLGDVLAAQGYNIDRRKIHLDEPIRTLGEHKVTIKLHREVAVDVTVHVDRQE